MTDLFHLIWKYPQQPSRLKDASLHKDFYNELNRLRRDGVLSLHRLFVEQHHLDALVSLKCQDVEGILTKLRKRMDKFIRTSSAQAPLYFETSDSTAFDRFERAKNLEIESASFDPIPSPWSLDIRPLGESRRFVVREGSRLSWPTRRVFYLQTL